MIYSSTTSISTLYVRYFSGAIKDLVLQSQLGTLSQFRNLTFSQTIICPPHEFRLPAWQYKTWELLLPEWSFRYTSCQTLELC